MLSPEQKDALETPFAPHQIRQREGPYGQLLDYVEAHTVIARLNQALHSRWSFEILEYRLREELDELIVLGRLSAAGISKSQFGSARLSRERATEKIVNLGDDLKAAASDALKKCATLFGVGLHLYAQPPDSPHFKENHDDPAPPTAPTADPGESAASPSPSAPKASAGTSFGRHWDAPLSHKQSKLIAQLCEERQLSSATLTHYCTTHYGVDDAQDLSKVQASQLIEALFAGTIKAA